MIAFEEKTKPGHYPDFTPVIAFVTFAHRRPDVKHVKQAWQKGNLHEMVRGGSACATHNLLDMYYCDEYQVYLFG